MNYEVLNWAESYDIFYLGFLLLQPRPKSIPDLHCAKRKAVTPAISDNEPSASGLRKKAKKEWKCTLCQINATSQKHLNKHMRGKKHKAKEAAEGTLMIGKEQKHLCHYTELKKV